MKVKGAHAEGHSKALVVDLGSRRLGVLFVPSALRVSCKYVGVGVIEKEQFESFRNHT